MHRSAVARLPAGPHRTRQPLANPEMDPMTFSRWCFLLFLALLPLGCGGGTASKTTDKPGPKPIQEDSLDAAADLLRKGADLARCQEAIRLLNTHLQQNSAARSKLLEGCEAPAWLETTLGLTREEIDFVGSTSFLPLDAHHLDLCFVLRDAAEALQLAGLSPLRQAELALDWVTRQAVLDTSNLFMTPSGFVLRRGHGSPEERAILFLALLHQLDLPGCMIGFPGDKEGETKYWCPGVVLEGKEKGKYEIYLFDTRLGQPLPGPGGKGVVTLAEVKAQPDLLRPLSLDERSKYDVGPEQVKKVQVYLVASLASVAPRLRWLEDVLNQRDHIRLALHPVPLMQLLEKAGGGQVQVWNKPGDTKAPALNHPLRCLRWFLPQEEGGLDRTGLQQEWQRRLEPWPVFLQNYRDQGVYDRLPPLGRDRLRVLTRELFKQYVLTPQEMYSRGQLDEMTRPLVRLRNELRHIDGNRGREVLAEERRQWVERVNQIALALVRKEPGASEAFAGIWHEDQFLVNLILGHEVERTQEQRRTPLSQIILTASAEVLSAEIEYLLALCWTEKAQRLEARAERLTLERKQQPLNPELESVRREARLAWVNALDWARQASERRPLSPGGLANRLQTLRFLWQAAPLDVEQALGLWEVLLHDIHRGGQIRLIHADGLLRSGERDQARLHFQRLAEELTTLLDYKEIRDLVKVSLERVAELPPPLNEAIRLRVLHATQPLEPGGSLPWLLHTARYRARLLRGS